MSTNKFLIGLGYTAPIILGLALLAFPGLESSSNSHNHKHEHRSHHSKRSPASLLPAPPTVVYPSERVNYEKLSKLVLQEALDKSLMKVKGSIKVRIELLDDYEEGQPFRLKAFVSSFRDINAADVKWTLGPGVEVLSGSTNGVVYNVNSKSAVEDEITLVKVSGDGKPARVFFHVSHNINGKVLSQTGYYSSEYLNRVETDPIKKLMANQPVIPDGKKVMY